MRQPATELRSTEDSEHKASPFSERRAVVSHWAPLRRALRLRGHHRTLPSLRPRLLPRLRPPGHHHACSSGGRSPLYPDSCVVSVPDGSHQPNIPLFVDAGTLPSTSTPTSTHHNAKTDDTPWVRRHERDLYDDAPLPPLQRVHPIAQCGHLTGQRCCGARRALRIAHLTLRFPLASPA